MGTSSSFALLLDFDGTMADTVSPLARIYADFVRRIGAGDGAPSFREANGMDLGRLIADLSRRFAPHEDADRVWRDYWQEVSDAVFDAEPCAGLPALLAWARTRQWKIGIASSSRSDVIARWLRLRALESYIDDIVGADLVPRSKPHPDIYLGLMQRLGATPGNSIAIEDSPSGARAARAAAVEVIFIAPDRAARENAGRDAAEFCYIARDLAAATDYLRRQHGDTGA